MTARRVWLGGLQRRVLTWPRLARMILAAVVALVVTLAVVPLVDELYLRLFFQPLDEPFGLYPELTSLEALIPSLISVAIGGLTYIVGWALMVGNVAEPPPPRRVLVLYWLLALFALGMVIVLIAQGVSMST